MEKDPKSVQPTNKSHRLLRAVIYALLLLTLLAACNQGSDPSTPIAESLVGAPATPTAMPTAQGAAVVLFTTPPPVRTEEPLTGGDRNIPSVFPGIVKYTPIKASLIVRELPPSPATSLAEAALAVVQIRRCDSFGCDTPVGSGVIIHRSGLILTAHHVLLVDPEDPTSARYPDFVVAVTTNIRNAPQPLYKARVVAEKSDQDMVLLRIDRDQAGSALAFGQIVLPALPLADLSNLFGGELPILGYPVTGGEAIHVVAANFSSFDDNGRLIVVNPAPDSGNSGGPALLEQTGRFAVAGMVSRRRSTQGQLSQEGLLRAIDQLERLTWTPKMLRSWGETPQANVQASSEGDLLQLTLTLNTLDLRTQPLRLFFYASDAASSQPWQPANANAPLVLWADVPPQQVIERRMLTLTVPLASLGTTPDHLRFHALLWDNTAGSTLWADASGVQAAPGALTLAPAAATDAPMPTPTATPTFTPSPTDTATVLPTASATSLPISTPTTPSAATPTAMPTDTATVAATATATLSPTPTDTPTPDNRPPQNPTSGQVWTEPTSQMEFVYVPAGEFLMGSTDAQVQEAGELCKKYYSSCNTDWYNNEKPQKTISTTAYWMGKTEVTNVQFRPFVEGDGYSNPDYWTEAGWKWRSDNKVTKPGCWENNELKGETQPVVCVSWYEAIAYAAWLKAKTGLDVRLPTEAEWEKAARGEKRNIFPWGNEWGVTKENHKLNYFGSDDGFVKTAPVGNFPNGESPYGTMDMAGNVWEWNSTAWGGCDAKPTFAYPYNATDGREEPSGEGCRLLRGGSWFGSLDSVRAAFRSRYFPLGRVVDLGFRLLFSVPPALEIAER